MDSLNVGRVAAFISVVLAVLGSFARAEIVRNRDLNFEMSIPDRFRPFSPPVQNDKTIYTFVDAPPPNHSIVISIGRMGGVLPRDAALDENHMAQGATPLTLHWNDHAIGGMRMQQTVAGVAVVTLVAQVPLSPQALQITVGGDPADEKEMLDLLQRLLTDLKGRSNWSGGGNLKRIADREAKVNPMTVMIGLVMVAGGILGLKGFKLPWFKKDTGRGKVIVVSIVLLVLGGLIVLAEVGVTVLWNQVNDGNIPPIKDWW